MRVCVYGYKYLRAAMMSMGNTCVVRCSESADACGRTFAAYVRNIVCVCVCVYFARE